MKDTGKRWQSLVRRTVRHLRRFGRDRSGLGGVEFAIVTPLLLMLYITAFELTVGFSALTRVSRAAGDVSDLVAQQQGTVTKSYLRTMKDAAERVFSPYSAEGLKIKISAIRIDSTGAPTIYWSWAEDGSRPYTPGSAAVVPPDMIFPDRLLIHTEISLPHQLLMFMPKLVPSEVRTVTLSRDFYYWPRMMDKDIKCSDC